MFSSNSSQVSSAANFVEDVFSTWLYTGNGSTRSINNGIDLAGKGGLVWTKSRSNSADHSLTDTATGANKQLITNGTFAQQSYANELTAFNSNGYNLGNNSSYGATNVNTWTYASWTFRKQPKFFDVVTWTGDGQNDRQVPHSLGSTPGCVIVKCLNFTGGGGPQPWAVYHRSVSPAQSLVLNSTAAAAAGDGLFGAATSTYFVVNQPGGGNTLNANGDQYVAYVFAHNAGGFGLTGTDNVISCGSYTGTGAAGNAINLGYEPQWVLIKRTDSTGNWNMTDTMREMSVTNDLVLYANLSNAEFNVGGAIVYPTATGFTCGTGSAGWNASGGTYIYIAIRRGPMKTPTTGTSVFAPVLITGGGDTPVTSTLVGFPADLTFGGSRVANPAKAFVDRLRGRSQYLLPYSVNGEDVSSANQDLRSWSMDGFTVGQLWNTSFNEPSGGSNGNVLWNFRRAPGFFDVVCYTGTGSARTVNHNLGVVPELMIVKTRSGTSSWFVYTASTGNQGYVLLNSTDAFYNPGSFSPWNSTTPTSSVFSLYGTGWNVNDSGSTYVWYGFASCPGVSKVGSYTGTGALQTINCGFTGGARFVLIKATSTTGDWYVWDSARGITASTDPYLLLNSTAAEVTTTNWVDTDSTGFKLTAASGNLANTNGTSYIFLSVA